MDIGYKKVVSFPFSEARAKVEEELKKEGFGVLTEIDVKATMKKKLDVDFNNYLILGACNPPLAHQALTMNMEIGTLLPCNVIIYDTDEGETIVSAMNVRDTMGQILPELKDLAEQVSVKLNSVIDRL